MKELENNEDRLAKEILRSDLSEELKIEVLKKILKNDPYIPTPVIIEQPVEPLKITYTDRTDVPYPYQNVFQALKRYDYL